MVQFIRLQVRLQARGGFWAGFIWATGYQTHHLSFGTFPPFDRRVAARRLRQNHSTSHSIYYSSNTIVVLNPRGPGR